MEKFYDILVNDGRMMWQDNLTEDLLESSKALEILRLNSVKEYGQRLFEEKQVIVVEKKILNDGAMNQDYLIRDIKILLDNKEGEEIPLQEKFNLRIYLQNTSFDIPSWYIKEEEKNICEIKTYMQKELLLVEVVIQNKNILYNGKERTCSCYMCREEIDKENLLFLLNLKGEFVAGNNAFSAIYNYNDKYIIAENKQIKTAFVINWRKKSFMEVGEYSTDLIIFLNKYNHKQKEEYRNKTPYKILKEKDLLIIKQNEKWGIIDLNYDKWIIPAQYDWFYLVEDRVVGVKDNLHTVYSLNYEERYKINLEKNCYIQCICKEFIIIDKGSESIILKNLERINKERIEVIKQFDQFLLIRIKGEFELIDLQTEKYVLNNQNISQEISVNLRFKIFREVIDKPYLVLYSRKGKKHYFLFSLKENNAIIIIHENERTIRIINSDSIEYFLASEKNLVIANLKGYEGKALFNIEDLIVSDNAKPILKVLANC